MLERFLKTRVATVSDAERCRKIKEVLTEAGIPCYCKTKDVNRRNAIDQSRMGTLGIKPKVVTEIFVDKENAAKAMQIVHMR